MARVYVTSFLSISCLSNSEYKERQWLNFTSIKMTGYLKWVYLPEIQFGSISYISN